MQDEISLPVGLGGASSQVQPEEVMAIEKESESMEFKTLDQLEKEHILYALDVFKGNKTKAAKALGITIKTLYNKLHSYGMMG